MPYLVVREMGGEQVVPLASGEVYIGRSRSNEVKLFTEQCSRRHCRVVRTDKGSFKLEDVNSSNGTYVNGVKAGAKDLVEGDQIVIGQALIVFKNGDPPQVAAPPQPEEATVPIPLEDRNVRILLETIIQAASSNDLNTFLRVAVDNIIEIVQAERGILFVKKSDEDPATSLPVLPGVDLRPLAARDDDRNDLAEFAGMSRSIPLQVFETRKAVYLLDTEQQHDAAVQSQSVSIYQLRTVMCSPLRVGEKLLGVLYVDSRAKGREYTSTDLALFEAVTNYLALTIENVSSALEAQRRQEEQRGKLERENSLLRSALERRRHLIGESPVMKTVYGIIGKVAPTDATALILGESGTGKEVIAHTIHDLSSRAQRPFVVIDCASIPETLLESELFGYEKGAFTGAVGQKPGKFELAQGGTLFLDEIAELSAQLQVKLLRALEQRVITRVGGVEPVKIDSRLVAATNRNLEELVAKGKFRQDLYFRLKVVTINVPPLRDRGNDILLLADFLLQEANKANGRTIRGFSEAAKHAILGHRWEGNVRELKHSIEQAVILTGNDILSPEDLNLGSKPVARTLEAARDLFEKSHIVKALAAHQANVTHTARALGISRQHLQTLIKKHGITKYEDTE